MKKLAMLALLSAPLLTLPVLADDCKFSADRSAEIDGAAISKVVIGAGAGDLVIRGGERNGVQAEGRACASSDELLNQIRIESRREGGTLYLKTVLPESSGSLFGSSRHAYLDLTVSVPASAALSVEDSSGDLQLHGVQSAIVADSSGDQTVGDIAGDLDVTDSSGELRITRVGGNLRLKDSSGDIDVNDVRGDVEVTVDSSGDLAIRKVAGNVHVITDTSGDIGISDAQRDVTIDTDTSGRIRAERVGGNFTVGADGSGSIHYDDVLGTVRIPDES